MPWLIRNIPSQAALRATAALRRACSREATWITGSSACRWRKTVRYRLIGRSEAGDPAGWSIQHRGSRAQERRLSPWNAAAGYLAACRPWSHSRSRRESDTARVEDPLATCLSVHDRRSNCRPAYRAGQGNVALTGWRKRASAGPNPVRSKYAGESGTVPSLEAVPVSNSTVFRVPVPGSSVSPVIRPTSVKRKIGRFFR